MSTTIYVDKGKTYDFSYQLGHLAPWNYNAAHAQLALTVNGHVLGGYHEATSTITTVSGSWTSDVTGSVTIAINDKLATGYGNDFWIDNISFVQRGTSTLSTMSANTGTESDDVITHAELDASQLPTGQAMVNIADSAAQTLHLTLNDILSEAHDNLFIHDGKKQLAITGDAGDVVELKVEDLKVSEWQDAGHVTAGGIQYDIYQHAGADVELLVQQGVELHQVA